MAISAAEDDILLGLVHRLNAFVAFQAPDALRISFALRLVDPVPRRQSCARDRRSLNRNRSRRTVAGGCFLARRAQTAR